MKIKQLPTILLLCLLFGAGCTHKRPVPNYYKNLYTQKILTKTQFDSLTSHLYLTVPDSLRNKMALNINFKDIKTANDSVIQSFDYDIRVGTEYLVRSYSYEKIGMNIVPRKRLSLDGDSILIGGKQDKPMLINLWFIECPGCVAEIPALNRLKEKYAGKVNFVAMTFDDSDRVKKFLNNKPFTYTHLANAGDVIEYIGSKPYPESIFINKDGRIEYIEGGLSSNPHLDEVIKHFELILQKMLQQ